MATRGRKPRAPKQVKKRGHKCRKKVVRVNAHPRSPRKKGAQKVRSYTRSRPC